MNPEALPRMREAFREAVTEVFELDIKPEAQRNSPVARGTNRRSIDTEVLPVPEGVRATIFTQSGYGGYLELGTRFMAARPYIKPAFDKFVGSILDRARAKLKATK